MDPTRAPDPFPIDGVTDDEKCIFYWHSGWIEPPSPRQAIAPWGLQIRIEGAAAGVRLRGLET